MKNFLWNYLKVLAIFIVTFSLGSCVALGIAWIVCSNHEWIFIAIVLGAALVVVGIVAKFLSDDSRGK
jgi:hypothetical protein